MARPSELDEPDRGAQASRRLTLLLGNQDDEALQEQPVSLDEFAEYCRSDPARLFEVIYRAQDRHIHANQELIDEITALHGNHENDGSLEAAAQQLEIQRLQGQLSVKDQELQNKNAEIVDLTAGIAAQIKEVEAKRDHYARQVANLVSQSVNTPRTTKSTKITDPPELDDGKDPRFEDWLMLMKNKLAANADHFNTPELRKAYVVGRCTSDALKHVSPRMREGAPNGYSDSDDILKHLENIYGDPNRVVNAKRRYHSLLMKPCDKFHNFLSEFLYLAGEAGVNENDWKEDLYNKLTFKLQELVIAEANRADGSFKEFSDYCSQTSNRLEAIQSRQRNISRKGTSVNDSSNTNSGQNSSRTALVPSRQATPGIKREGTPARPVMDDSTRTRLSKEGKCFSCFKPGHLARDCPDKVTAQLQTLEQTEETDEIEEIPRKDMGKDHA